MTNTQEAQKTADFVQRLFCLPCSLLLNFGLFQYLVFRKRHRGPLVRLLFVTAFLSFAHLVPATHSSDELVDNLSDASDAYTVMTFLQQIIILIRDINRKVKLSVVARLARITELLVLVGFAVTLVNIAELNRQELQTHALELFDDTTKYVSLAFVAYFRFHFLVLARGSTKVWRHQKLEMVYYMLLVTHAAPFIILSYATGLHLDHV